MSGLFKAIAAVFMIPFVILKSVFKDDRRR